jgi:hypothetical protein
MKGFAVSVKNGINHIGDIGSHSDIFPGRCPGVHLASERGYHDIENRLSGTAEQPVWDDYNLH